MNTPHIDRLLVAAAALLASIAGAEASRADQSCAVSFEISGAVDLGSADFGVTFDPADLEEKYLSRLALKAVRLRSWSRRSPTPASSRPL